MTISIKRKIGIFAAMVILIMALSASFNTLKTREQTVTLNRELRIVEDYMYLQKMRFGSRIRYSLDLETDAANAVIPSLSLQPLVENAVVHGLSKKENGGILHIRIWKRGEILILSVSDTGLGMSKERCEEVSAAMKERRTSKIGIGLLTPPVGAVLFIGSAVAKIPMEKVVKATLPFYLCMIITLMLITFVPGVSLWLPSIFAH